MKNSDMVRRMTDEELADILQGQCACCAYQLTGCTEKECYDGAYEWLQKSASDTTSRSEKGEIRCEERNDEAMKRARDDDYAEF